uniref:Uncharacterized protein n=1 Tax=Anguilla anguilla TaxID=7936 RepID=A0A0E9UP59_ANGAN
MSSSTCCQWWILSEVLLNEQLFSLQLIP